jgi:peptide chain release factor
MNLWLQITSGRGPAECQYVVAQLAPIAEQEAKALGLGCEPIDAVSGDESKTLRSVLLSLSGEESALSAFAARWVGSILWVGKSPFRPHHKRQNWFVGVERFEVPTAPAWHERDLEFSTLRASGPGGQHVNKTESAVRLVHRPSGLSVVAREERSQQQNKRLALARLAALFEQQGKDQHASAEKQRWDQHNSLERGNPIRTFAGPDFRERRGA